jgi:hypothetical protein
MALRSIQNRKPNALKHVGMSTSEWNNRPGRTKEEVVAALREAAQQH